MDKEISISFLGDISLNASYEEMYLKKIKPFDAINEILEDTIVVGNVECFSRGDNGINELKKPRLDTGLETLNFLCDFNLQIACLANNHVYDHLEDGFIKTKIFLHEKNIKTIGASIEKDEFNKHLIIDENGIKVGLLNYVTEDTNPKPPVKTDINLNWFDLNKTIIEIEKLRVNVDHIVVILHWGGRVEGGLFPDWNQPKIARKLIDAGADLIIGHHSHTVQPYETYKGKSIFYSLGNFCFDDIYQYGELYTRLSKRQKISIIPQVKFYKEAYKVDVKAIKNKNNFIVPFRISLKYKLFNSFFKIIKNFKIIWSIYFFKYRKINPIFNYIFVQRKSILKAVKIHKIKKYLKK
jgi:hypothetical protein